MADTKKITLKFKKSIWLCVNGHVYEGQEIQSDDMKTAAELVRLAKEAYGWDILA